MDYEKLKEVIAKQIKENGQREITGPVLQAVLMAMVDSLGEVYPQTYTDEEKAQARANIDALSNYDGEIAKEKLSLEVQAILNDVANKQNISDATLATIAKTIVGAINEVYKGGLEDASIATSKIKDGAITDAKIANGAVTTPKIANDAVTTEKVYDGAITEPKLDTDLVNIITSAVQPAGLASAIATALASYVAKADIVDTTGSATDKVMSQHGVTEAIDGVTNKVTELELSVDGIFSKSYDVKAGVTIEALSASSPYAIPLILGEGESFIIHLNTSVVSRIITYAIKSDGSTQSIGGLNNNNVMTFSAPVDMVALGVYIPGSYISADGTYTLTVTKTPLWQTQKDVTELLKKARLVKSINYKVNAIPSDLFDESEFIIGDNWHGIIDTSAKHRVSMASIHIADRDLYLSVLDGYRFALDFFVDGVYSSYVSFQQYPYKIPQGTEYVLKIARYPEDTSLEADLELFVSKVRIQSEFQQTLFGKGLVGYYGKRVSPLKMQKNYQCDENVLISQTMPSDSNNVNKDAAGLVVYGNRIFSFNNGATCSVFALDTLELLEVASLPWSAHNNNAQPTPYFYDSGDTYPLFLVSRGDYAGNGEQKFYFVRVVESSGNFTFTIVKEVSYSGFPGAEYNCSWFANYELGELYCYGYPNGAWSVTQNNPILFHKFDLPSLDNYDPVTLTGAGIKETITLQDHWIMQSGLYHNGKIFIQVEGDSTWDLTINGQTFDKSLGLHWLFVINAESGYIESYVPLYNSIEQEGMCIYDGEMYMSEKYTTAPVGRICFRVVKYNF